MTLVNLSGHDVDLEGCRVRSPDGWLTVKPRSMDVLRYLLSHRGELCTRAAILDAVWGRSEVTDDVLTQAVRDLRHALADDPRAPQTIETIPRRGYRLIAGETQAAQEAGDGDLIPVRQHTGWRLTALGLALVSTTAVLLWAWSYYWRESPTIVVLPFEHPQGDLQIVSDGLTDEITARLARQNALQVVARTTAYAVHERALEVTEIATLLDASLILAGSVYRERDRLRIHVQLLDADGLHRWAETFSEQGPDMFSLFNRVGARIEERLADAYPRIGLRSLAASAEPVPDTAFLTMMQAEQALRESARIPSTSALEGFEAAVAMIPRHGPAWSGLAAAALVLGISPVYRFTEPAAAGAILERAQTAAAKALELDSEDARAIAVQAALFQHQGRWLAADEMYRSALALFPGSAELLAHHAAFLYRAGYIAEGFAQARRAFRLDPLSPTSTRMMFIGAFANLDLDAAQEYLELTEHLTGSRETVNAAKLFAVRGQYDAAATVLREDGWVDFARRDEWFDALRATVSGEKATAEFGRLLRRIEDSGGLEPVTAVSTYAAVGLPREALRCLAGLESLLLIDTLWFPIYKDLRALPDFAEVMIEHGLGELWQQHGLPPGISRDSW